MKEWLLESPLPYFLASSTIYAVATSYQLQWHLFPILVASWTFAILVHIVLWLSWIYPSYVSQHHHTPTTSGLVHLPTPSTFSRKNKVPDSDSGTASATESLPTLFVSDWKTYQLSDDLLTNWETTSKVALNAQTCLNEQGSSSYSAEESIVDMTGVSGRQFRPHSRAPWIHMGPRTKASGLLSELQTVRIWGPIFKIWSYL